MFSRSKSAENNFKDTPSKLIRKILTMPGMTGFNMARRMLQIRPDIPIILCTGYSALVDEQKAKSQGIREFAMKPLNNSTIAGLIRKVLDAS